MRTSFSATRTESRQLRSTKCERLLRWSQAGFHGYGWEFVAAEELGFAFRAFFLHFLGIFGFHFGHGFIGLAVVVGGVPEEESDAAFGAGGFYLNLDVFGRVGFGAPAEGLQPRADDHAAREVSIGMGDEFEAGHG